MEILHWVRVQLFGMKWLKLLTAYLLERCGVDVTAAGGAALHFFVYDTAKIFILLGVLIFAISYVQSYFPPERTKRILGGHKGIGANFAAALLGTVTPFCACSSVPLFIGFVASGLPLGCVFSFLIASPMVDLGSLVILGSVFGWKVATGYVALGVAIAVTGGTLIGLCHMEDGIEEFVRHIPSAGGGEEQITLKVRIYYAASRVKFTVQKVWPYIVVGVAIGAFIHNKVPAGAVSALLGKNNPSGVLIAVAAGAPMYADIFGTIPVAEALLSKGAQLGTVLAFMMAVTTLSVPSLVMLRKAVKPELLTFFVLLCVSGIVAAGYLFNALQPLFLN